MITRLILLLTLFLTFACGHDDSDDAAPCNLPDQASEVGCEHTNR